MEPKRSLLFDRQSQSQSLQKFQEIGILVGGVVGGLLVVIAVMILLKYCMKVKRHLSLDQDGQPRTIKQLVGSIQPNLRTIRLFRQFKASDPNEESKCGCPENTSTAKAVEKDAETIELSMDNEIDAAVAEYIDKIKDEQNDSSGSQTAIDSTKVYRKAETITKPDSQNSESEISRHVSFEVEDETTYPPPSKGRDMQAEGQENGVEERKPTGGRKSSSHLHAPLLSSKSASLPLQNKPRYTEGDFHHLKASRIDRSPETVARLAVKQRSLPMSHQQPDDEVTERTPMLSPVPENRTKSQFARQQWTKVKAEVHAGVNKDAKIHIRPVDKKYDRLPTSRELLRRDTQVGSFDRMPRKLPCLEKVKRSQDNISLLTTQGYELHVRSLDHAFHTPNKLIHVANRRVRSYEEDFIQQRRRTLEDIGMDYDRFKITEFSRMPSSNPNFDTISENLPSDLKSKVRYNDIGSFEEINDVVIDGIVEDMNVNSGSDAETLNGTKKYKDLWILRSTLEEDEELSDTIRMENQSSPEELSPEEKGGRVESVTSSFDSNMEPPVQPVLSTRSASIAFPTHNSPSAHLLHPQYENRRRSYQSIFTRRNYQRTNIAGLPRPDDTSFDSFETMDTDGDVSESSRQEVTTTSFESSGTTDNTDSTGDSASHKLQHMRGDSGYKSLETQNSQCTTTETSPKSPKSPKSTKSNFLLPGPDNSQRVDPKTVKRSPKTSPQGEHTNGGLAGNTNGSTSPRVQALMAQSGRSSSLPESARPSRSDPHRTSHYFDRRAAKTASKKRRDFRAPTYKLRIHESVQEAESDSKSDQPSGDSFEDANQGPKRFAVFNKATQRSKSTPVRDFSIDEKTDAVFSEFLRYDDALDSRAGKVNGQSNRSSPHEARLHRKNSEAVPVARRVRCQRGGRSVSVDHNSVGLGPFHKLSPQDSIEEENEEDFLNTSGYSRNHSKERKATIPVIMLAKDSVDA